MSADTFESFNTNSIIDKVQDFKISLKVRDYECDMQGIVNNSIYMHYLEHARHEYLSQIGLNWKKLIDKGIYLVAIKIEAEYKKTLTPH